MRTGFIGLTNAISLAIAKPLSNGHIPLTLTGQSGMIYPVESSSDFEQWHPFAFLLNTNGTAEFGDIMTNSPSRFYRVLIPLEISNR